MVEADRQLRTYVQQLIASTNVGAEGAHGFFDDDAFRRRVEAAPLARDDRERDAVRRAHGKLLRGRPLDAEESGLYEAIVLPTERPAIIVENGTIVAAPPPWQDLKDPAKLRQIERAIAAVGRIELRGSAGRAWTGTAFVVGRGLLMTNRHVARDFTDGIGRQVRFIDGGGAVVDFGREGDARGRDIAIGRVVLIHPYWDMALLAVEGLDREPLRLAPDAPDDCVKRKVVVVGHPGRPRSDDRTPERILQRVFGEQFGIKRVQPGHVMGAGSYTNHERTVKALKHDSSTLGGNSGSAVVDVTTGDVLGLHFAGEYRVANYAVASFDLARDPFVHEAGVAFRKGAPESPSPWEREWRDAERAAAIRPVRSTPRGVRVPSPTPQSTTSATRSVRTQRVTVTLDVRIRVREKRTPR